MRKQWKRIMRRIIACVLIVALVLPNTVVAAPKPEINKKSIILCKKEKYQLKISHQRKKPKWKTTNKKVVSVSKNGFIKGKKSGTATITGYAGGKKYKCKVTVADTKKSVYAGKTISLKSKSLKKYKKWNSSSTKIATVNKSGKVKTKKAGTVVITAKYKKKTYRFKLTVKKPEPATIYVDKYSNEAITTDKSDYVLSGTIKSKRKIKKVSESYNSDSNTKTKSLTINGTKKWKTKKIPLDIGYNYVTIAVSLTSGKSVKKKIQVNRTNKELKLNKNVVSFNPDDKKDLSTIREIQMGILGSIIDNKGTEDATDDELLLAVYNDNPLLQKIKKGEIKKNEIVYIPENKYFIEGLTQKYLYCDDNYPGKLEYNKEQCEVIHFAAANFFDLFSGDIYLDYEGLENSKISSIYTPSRKEDKGIATFSNDNEDNEENNGDNSGEKGFQFKKLATAMENCIKLDGNNLSFDVGNLVLYDNDGNLKDTDDDQVVLSGKMAYSGITSDFKPNNTNENMFKSTVEFSEQTQISLKWGKGIDFFSKIKEELKEADEENTQNMNSRVALSGVDMNKSIVLGVVAISPGVKPLSISNDMDEITGGVEGFKPKIFIALLLDLDGSIRVETSLTYDHRSYHKTGIAIKRGSYTQEECTKDCDLAYADKQKKIHELNLGKVLGKISYAIIDICKESKGGKDLPSSTIRIGCEGSAELSAGIGLGIGIGVLGIVPVLAKLGVVNNMSIKGDLDLILSNKQLDNTPKEHPNMIVGQSNVQGTDSLVLNGALYARVAFEYKGKTVEIGKDINQNGKDLLTLVDKGFFITNPKGTIYDEKDPVSDVKVSFIEIKEDGTIKELEKNSISNEKGEYDINLFYYPEYEKKEAPFSNRMFGLKFEKDGYETTYVKFEDEYWDGLESFANIKLKEKTKKDEEIDKISNPANGSWDCIEFGKYWQNDTNKDGKVDENDEKEPIKWRVMQKYPVNKVAFLISDKILDVKPFNKTKSTVWKKSMIRSYLNGYSASENDDGIDFSEPGKNFMQNAFTKKDQKHLEDRLLDSDNNPSGDLVHIAAPFFINNSQYGFNGNKNRIAEITDYAKEKAKANYVKGTYLTGTTTSEGDKKYHCYVTENGEIKKPGCADPDTGKYGGIRVIIAIDLKKANWTYAGKTN